MKATDPKCFEQNASFFPRIMVSTGRPQSESTTSSSERLVVSAKNEIVSMCRVYEVPDQGYGDRRQLKP